MSTFESSNRQEISAIYIEESNQVCISVRPEYIREQSSEENNYYFFAYHIKVENRSSETVQLISRHWLITNGKGIKEEVKGEGVVGLKPKIEPGKVFEYSSFCPLPTMTGHMRGKFSFLNLKTKEMFWAKVPLFFLRHPQTFQ